MQKEQLIEWLANGVKSAGLSDTAVPALERPKQADHGDYATNIALQLAKPLGKNPREVATALKAALDASPHPLVSEITIAGPGFINIRLNPAAKFSVVADVLKAGEKFGYGDARKGEKVLVEFVSANPTGPLHTGHARQAALGDTLCNLLETQGCTVYREFYYNDAGNQIDNLTRSVMARARGIEPGEAGWPEDGYQGEYIKTIARDVVFLSALNATLAIKEVVRRGQLCSDPVVVSAQLKNPQSVELIKQMCLLEAARVRFDLDMAGLDRNKLLSLSSEIKEKLDATVELFDETDGNCWFGATEENIRSVNGIRQWVKEPQTRRIRIRLMAEFGAPRDALRCLGKDAESDDLSTVIKNFLTALSEDAEFVRAYAVAVLRKEQQVDLKAFGLRNSQLK